MFKAIKKRDGTTVKFESRKICGALEKAGLTTGEFDGKVAGNLTLKVLSLAQSVLTHKPRRWKKYRISLKRCYYPPPINGTALILPLLPKICV